MRPNTVSFLLLVRGLVILACPSLCGCANLVWFWNSPMRWSLKPMLKSVPEDQPHGTLVLKRNDPDLFVLVDDRVPFPYPKTRTASFRLAPGSHTLQAKFLDSKPTSSYIMTTYSDILERSVTLSPGTETTVSCEVDWTGFRTGYFTLREE